MEFSPIFYCRLAFFSSRRRLIIYHSGFFAQKIFFGDCVTKSELKHIRDRKKSKTKKKGSFKNDKRNFERGNLEGRATRTGRRRNFPRFKKGSQIHADGLLRQDDKAQLDTLTRAWGKEGITVVMHNDDVTANEYIKDGQTIGKSRRAFSFSTRSDSSFRYLLSRQPTQLKTKVKMPFATINKTWT